MSLAHKNCRVNLMLHGNVFVYIQIYVKSYL